VEEKDDTPINFKPKKKTKTKGPSKAAAKKVAPDDDEVIDWDDEEFRDLDFNDDENIIFIK